jgi:hypothetical protein
VLDLADLRKLEKDELEELFRRSSAGELPDGEAEGIILVPAIVSRIIRLAAWRGKRFDRHKGELENRILPFGVRAVRAKVYKEPSWFDGQETIVLDYSKTSFVARKIRDEIREIAPGVYLGLVYWGRENVGLFALKLSR